MWEKGINFIIKPVSGQDDPKKMMNEDISMFVNENNANQASNNPNSTESTELNESTESIEATTSTAPLLIIHSRVDLSEKAFAKDVPKRGAPTKAEKKIKTKCQAITSQKSKSIKIIESNTQLYDFISFILIDNSKDFINSVIDKKQLIDEVNIIVDPKAISAQISNTGFICTNGIIKDQIIEFFTSDGFIMLENVLGHFLKSLKSCKICNLSCENKWITCGDCNNDFHLKCVNRTYIPIKKVWKCNNCSK
ncbi:hypothetical protein BpHYR1_002094 [Brachionus plicatilis]|uniref:PHD-type domain-containing protein n=1 Tax=Brachionus plicatilis TaxID=10195 RepID=A0A3M7T9C3_BRAPC|nr:hypothetical protein BpHYR1_002094 [Brachionus plicatilis]